MRRPDTALVILFVLMVVGLCPAFNLFAAPPVIKSTKIRHYTGIGVLTLVPLRENDPVQLYVEPAISRIGGLDLSRLPSYEWGLDSGVNTVQLIVTSKNGVWLRVAYDDSGREAWLKQPAKAKYEPWDSFLKGRSAILLAGLQKKYYQISSQPGAVSSGVIGSRQAFRIIRVEKDWAMVMQNKDSLVWLRWRDEDGRFLIGLECSSVSNT